MSKVCCEKRYSVVDEMLLLCGDIEVNPVPTVDLSDSMLRSSESGN